MSFYGMSGDGPKPAAEVLIRGREATPRPGSNSWWEARVSEWKFDGVYSDNLAGFIRLSIFLGSNTA